MFHYFSNKVIYPGMREKRPKCVYIKKHLDLFRSYPSICCHCTKELNENMYMYFFLVKVNLGGTISSLTKCVLFNTNVGNYRKDLQAFLEINLDINY